MSARSPVLHGLAALLLCAGCRVWGPVHDLQSTYDREEAQALFAIPRRAGDSPVAAANAPEVMQGTVRRARKILAGAGPPPQGWTQPRALLAAALALQGRREDARDVLLQGRLPRETESLSVYDRLLLCTDHAVTAARALAGYRELLRMFAHSTLERAEVERFLDEYSTFMSIELPARGDWRRDGVVLGFQQLYYPDAGDPAKARTDLRQRFAAQVYNDAAALVVNLPPAGSGAPTHLDRRLAAIGAGLFVSYSQLQPDLLPEELNDIQKEWLREQAIGAFENARRAMERLVDADTRRHITDTLGQPKHVPEGTRYAALYAALVRAERDTMGWITTR